MSREGFSPEPRIFISYSHKDGNMLAPQIRSDLAEKGYVVWLDVTPKVNAGPEELDARMRGAEKRRLAAGLLPSQHCVQYARVNFRALAAGTPAWTGAVFRALLVAGILKHRNFRPYRTYLCNRGVGRSVHNYKRVSGK